MRHRSDFVPERRMAPPLLVDPGPTGRRPDGLLDRRGSMASITRRAELRAVFRERRLGERLERSLDGVGVVLHHRIVDHSSTPVDHLVVGPTGVSLIRAIHAEGRVVANPSQRRLSVGVGDDACTVEIASLDVGNVSVVERVLGTIGYDWVKVRRVLCLTKAGLHRDRRIDDVLVTTSRRLIGGLLGRGQLGPADVRTVASALHARFAPVSGHDVPSRP